MATTNPFDLLGDDDAEDPSQLIAAQQQAAAAPKKRPPSQPQAKSAAAPNKTAAKLPSKPLPPSQAVREAKNEAGRGGRGGGRGYGRGRGRGSSEFSQGFSNNENTPAGQGALEEGDSGKPSERRGYSGPRGNFLGGRRGELHNGEVGDGERPRRPYERRSGTGRGSEIKREGAGRGNWGTETDGFAPVTEEAINETENVGDENPVGEEGAADGDKETPANEAEVKEPKDKEMTLEEYEKVLEERRKALQAIKTEKRKVDAKEFASMQQLSSKKDNDDVFIKLGSDKDRKKEAAEKEDKAKKSVSINEFLKPAEGERYYSPGGRGRGRGRGSRGGYGGNYQGNAPAPSIEDPGHFPSLGGK